MQRIQRFHERAPGRLRLLRPRRRRDRRLPAAPARAQDRRQQLSQPVARRTPTAACAGTGIRACSPSSSPAASSCRKPSPTAARAIDVPVLLISGGRSDLVSDDTVAHFLATGAARAPRAPARRHAHGGRRRQRRLHRHPAAHFCAHNSPKQPVPPTPPSRAPTLPRSCTDEHPPSLPRLLLVVGAHRRLPPLLAGGVRRAGRQRAGRARRWPAPTSPP